jgi:hypothetical protein
MSGQVGFAGVELSSFTSAYDFAGVRDRGRPVKVLAERVADEGTRRGVVATDSGVDIP